MNCLVLTGGRENLKFSLFASPNRAAVCFGRQSGEFIETADVAAALKNISEQCREARACRRCWRYRCPMAAKILPAR